MRPKLVGSYNGQATVPAFAQGATPGRLLVDDDMESCAIRKPLAVPLRSVLFAEPRDAKEAHMSKQSRNRSHWD